MDQNSLIELGSKVNIILRFNSKVNINGKEYLANEPYLYLKDVDLAITYRNADKTAKQSPRTVIAHSNILPVELDIYRVPFTKKVASLLTTYQGEQDYNPSIFKEFVAYEDTEGGIIYLTENISEKDFYVYDEDMNLIEDRSAYDNTIVSSQFVVGNSYLVSFSSEKTGECFNLKKPSLPYMTLELEGTGNIDKTTKKVWIVFNKVSLNSVINFGFFNDDIVYIPLSFHIIDNEGFMVIED